MTGEQMKYITGSFLSVWAAALVLGLLWSAHISFGIVPFGKYPLMAMANVLALVCNLSLILFFMYVIELRKDKDYFLDIRRFLLCCPSVLYTFLISIVYDVVLAALSSIAIISGLLFSIKIKVEIEERIQK